jgi:uncharacterized protein (DUF433 family)
MLYIHITMFQLEVTQTVPLTQWEDGSVRVAGSRVTLESILYQFKLGASAEYIQESFPSLELREIYGAIFYYLQNMEAVEEYLRQSSEAAEEGKRFIDEHFDTKALRERIRARRAQMMKKSDFLP